MYYFYILALELASPGIQHCAKCIGTLSFPKRRREVVEVVEPCVRWDGLPHLQIPAREELLWVGYGPDLLLRYDTIRDVILTCADMSQLNLPHGNDN